MHGARLWKTSVVHTAPCTHDDCGARQAKPNDSNRTSNVQHEVTDGHSLYTSRVSGATTDRAPDTWGAQCRQRHRAASSATLPSWFENGTPVNMTENLKCLVLFLNYLRKIKCCSNKGNAFRKLENLVSKAEIIAMFSNLLYILFLLKNYKQKDFSKIIMHEKKSTLNQE